MILSRFVNPRAARMALITASVPELTIRIISIDGMLSQMSFAISTSIFVAAPKLNPLAQASITASNTSGWLCPKIIGPQEPIKSMYSFPSSSHILAPDARAIMRGVEPMEPKARTGELTPPGIKCTASSKIFSDFVINRSVLSSCTLQVLSQNM